MWNPFRRWQVTVAAVSGFALGVVVTLVAIAAEWIAPFQPPGPSKAWGEFPARARVELLPEGRQVKLLEDFAHIDPRARAWTAPKDTIVNGASIPKAFWSIAGGPFEGQYRDASIVHDEACARMTESWQSVHLMFYEACRCAGVPELKSKVLYAAVYHFGPRWGEKAVHSTMTKIGPDGKEHVVTTSRTVPVLLKSTQEPSAGVREKLERYVQTDNPSLADLKALDPNSL